MNRLKIFMLIPLFLLSCCYSNDIREINSETLQEIASENESIYNNAKECYIGFSYKRNLVLMIESATYYESAKVYAIPIEKCYFTNYKENGKYHYYYNNGIYIFF